MDLEEASGASFSSSCLGGDCGEVEWCGAAVCDWEMGSFECLSSLS